MRAPYILKYILGTHRTAPGLAQSRHLQTEKSSDTTIERDTMRHRHSRHSGSRREDQRTGQKGRLAHARDAETIDETPDIAGRSIRQPGGGGVRRTSTESLGNSRQFGCGTWVGSRVPTCEGPGVPRFRVRLCDGGQGKWPIVEAAGVRPSIFYIFPSFLAVTEPMFRRTGTKSGR